MSVEMVGFDKNRLYIPDGVCVAFTLLSLHSHSGSSLGPETKAAVD